MRIALVVHKFPPASVGGTEIYTLNLAQELSRRGHEVFVFYRHDRATTEQGETAWEKREGFRAYRVSRAFDVRSAPAFAQFLDTFLNPDVERAFQCFLDEVRPDIVHFQHMMLLSYRLIGLAKRRGLPALLTLHDYWFICSVSQLVRPDAQICRGKAFGLNCARCVLAARVRSSLMQTLRPIAAPLLQVRDALVRRAALKSDLLIAPSHFLIQQYIKAGFPADRFVYLENGIDVERIRRYPRRPSADGRVRFTYLGSLAWQKGVHVLVEAFQGIPSAEATLRIYGSPDVFPDYAARLPRMADPANTFLKACRRLNGARLYVGPEGGLYHAATALGIPAVAIFGGFVSPANQGYDHQTNLYEPDGSPCGMRVKCDHCTRALALITPEAVIGHVRRAIA